MGQSGTEENGGKLLEGGSVDPHKYGFFFQELLPSILFSRLVSLERDYHKKIEQIVYV